MSSLGLIMHHWDIPPMYLRRPEEPSQVAEVLRAVEHWDENLLAGPMNEERLDTLPSDPSLPPITVEAPNGMLLLGRYVAQVTVCFQLSPVPTEVPVAIRQASFVYDQSLVGVGNQWGQELTDRLNNAVWNREQERIRTQNLNDDHIRFIQEDPTNFYGGAEDTRMYGSSPASPARVRSALDPATLIPEPLEAMPGLLETIRRGLE